MNNTQEEQNKKLFIPSKGMCEKGIIVFVITKGVS